MYVILRVLLLLVCSINTTRDVGGKGGVSTSASVDIEAAACTRARRSRFLMVQVVIQKLVLVAKVIFGGGATTNRKFKNNIRNAKTKVIFDNFCV